MVWSVLALQLHPLRITLGNRYPNYQVVEVRGQEGVDLFGCLIERQFSNLESHSHERHLEAATWGPPSKGGFGNQMSQSMTLFD
jgi:hypothetical protein